MSIKPLKSLNYISTFDQSYYPDRNIYTNEHFMSLVLNGKLPKVPIPIEVYGDVNLSDKDFLRLPDETLIIKGSLDLRNCKCLDILPENLTVEGSLYLNGCKNLKKLPTDLVVRGTLYLDNYTEEPPKSLRKRGGSIHQTYRTLKEDSDSSSDEELKKVLSCFSTVSRKRKLKHLLNDAKKEAVKKAKKDILV